MAQPTTKTDWATATVNLPGTGQVNKVEPTGGLQSAGYDYPQIPTVEETNYWRASVHEWIRYFVDEKIPEVEAITLTAGDGITGGGDLTANRTFTLGIPSTITGSSTNSVTPTSHTHEVDNATTSQAGVVQLNDTVASTSTTEAATANAVKQANDNANSRVLDTRTFTAGDGLTGGGNLSADRIFDVDFADDAEAQAWTATDKVISPEKLAKAFQGSRQLLVGNGYQFLPGGLVIQWATKSAGTHNWPIAFPTACLSATATQNSVAAGATNTHNGISFTTANFTLTEGTDNSSDHHVIAIGH